MRRSLPFAVAVLAALAALPGGAAAEPEAGLARIVEHRLEARFDPAAHRLVAHDRVTLDVTKGRSFVFSLAGRVRLEAAGKPLEREKAEDGRYTATVPEGVTEVDCFYDGEVFDAVRDMGNASWLVGDETTGLISDRGIYLTGASLWYPRTAGDSMMRFDVTTYVPAPFHVVTQGKSPERTTLLAPKAWSSDTDVVPPAADKDAPTTTFHVAVARAAIPTDDLALSGGPFKTLARSVEGIDCAVWYAVVDDASAALWLDAVTEVVERYEGRFGSYPHPKFDVVENFFSSGYGMPSFTLIGDRAIAGAAARARASKSKIAPGYVDHEYVHGWFGNGLFVDPSDGNWCEAITSYFSNYWARELESKEAAADHRRLTLEKYSMRAVGEKDYPLRAFRTKAERKDDDIGYGKGLMFFHVLRRRLGDARFFDAVRQMCVSKVGQHVSWADWLQSLEGEWARPLLERAGAPAVRLASATAWPGGKPGTWVVRAEAVVQQPRGEAPWPAFDLDVDVGGKQVGTLRLDGKSGVWRGELAEEPVTLELDARYDALRRIADADLPPCLERTLAAPGVSLTAVGEAVQPFASRLRAERELARTSSASPTGPAPAVVLATSVLEDGRLSPHAAAVERWSGGRIVVDEKGVTVDGRRFDGPSTSLLFSANAAASEGGGTAPVTVYLAMSEVAAAKANALGYYGWEQYVVFDANSPVPKARGMLSREPKGTRRSVVRGDDAAARVFADVSTLASDEMAGRRPGTEGHAKAERWLLDRLKELGPEAATTQSMPFGLGVADLGSSRDLLLVTDEGTETLKDAFRPFFTSAERDAGKPLPYAEGVGAVPMPARIPDTSPEGLATFHEQVATGTAPAILLAPSPVARTALAAILDAPNALTPDAVAALDAPGRDGRRRPRPPIVPWIGSRRARAFPAAVPARVPVLVLEEAAIDRLERKPRVQAIDFAVSFAADRDAWATGNGGTNLVAYWPAPNAPAEKPPVVLVSAHYDSFGREGEQFFRGADDNGSGVAAVLEALRGVKDEWAKPGAVKRGLVVVFFDAEEWGLAGSRAFVRDAAKAFDVRQVVNVDSVGRVRDDSVHVVGLSSAPTLGPEAAKSLESAGLAVGRDIDAFAFREGSDHWPFHQAGVPAVTFWASDYGVMNEPTDDPQAVDPVGVVRVARSVRALLLRLLAAP
jgi:aminopeptidase N